MTSFRVGQGNSPPSLIIRDVNKSENDPNPLHSPPHAFRRYRHHSAGRGGGGVDGGSVHLANDNSSDEGPTVDRYSLASSAQPLLLVRDLTHTGLEEATLNGESIPAFK